MRLKSIALMVLIFLPVRSTHGHLSGQTPAHAEECHTAPERLEGGAIHILRIEVLSTQPTDGTYADEGYGQGEFDTVRLLEVVRSPIQWKRGLIFRVHPFSGERNEQQNLAPEHLTIGKHYYLVYTYHLDEEPHGDSDLIGLTRCGIHDDTATAREQLLSELRK